MTGSPQKISFRTLDGTTLRGYYYKPTQPKAPCIILTAGLSFLKQHFIDAFAVKFQQAGFGAIVYDHRHWGDSDGLPRNHANLFQEVEDYSDAITYTVSLAPEVDPHRICIWGAGHAGGVVMPVAAYDERVKCVVTMVPFISGSADAKYYPEGYLAQAWMERANIATMTNGKPWVENAKYAPIFASPNDSNSAPAVIGVPEAWTFYEQCKERSDAAGVAWDNKMTLQSLWYGSRWEPTREIEKIGDKPVLYNVAKRDKFIPLAEQGKVFDRLIGPKEFICLDSEHLETYMGATFEENVSKQVEWLLRWL